MLKYKKSRYWKPVDKVDRAIIDYIKDTGREPEAYQFTDLYKELYDMYPDEEEYGRGEEHLLLEEWVYDKIRWIVDSQCYDPELEGAPFKILKGLKTKHEVCLCGCMD